DCLFLKSVSKPMDSIASTSQLSEYGYAMLTGVFGNQETNSLADELSAALETEAAAVLRSRGRTYGSRDLIRLLPAVCEIPRHPNLFGLVSDVLGPHAGLVRALYFDKPPDRSWSLPWHKDRTIAVKDNTKPTTHFLHPTIKAGIPHVEAPEPLLSR